MLQTNVESKAGRRRAALSVPVAVRLAAPAIVAGLLVAILWLAPVELGDRPRLALLIFGLAVIGWTLTHISEATVALSAAVALVLAGVVETDRLYSALGHELIWLLLAAFVIATVLRGTTMMQRLALAALRPAHSISALVYLLTLVIGATAFVIPSTSGRAAVLLPVFLALADALDDQRLVRALALLFPSIILLSACASLTGAGAHVVALEFIALLPGAKTIGYLEWIKFGLPIALLSSLAAAALILRMFLTREERARPPKLPEPPTQPVSVRELAIAGGRCSDGASLGNLGLACCRDRDCRPRLSPAADAAARIGHWPEVGTQWRGVGTHSVPDRHVGDRRCVDRVGRSRIDRGAG